MKNAFRQVAVILLVFLIPTLIHAGGMGDDPQTLWLEAKNQLDRGEVESSQKALRTLESMLASDPQWDPDGSYSEVLIPSLASRISLMKDAVSKLETLAQDIESTPGPRESGEDGAGLRTVISWAEERTGQVRRGLHDITGKVPNGIDRGALLQSRAFERTESLIEFSVIPEMKEALVHRAEIIVDEDQRYRILKTRLDAVKRDLITSSVANTELERKLDQAGRNRLTCQRALFSLAGAGPGYMEKYTQPDGIGNAFSALVRNQLASIRTTHSQTPMEKAVRLEEIKRLRLLNESDLGGDNNKISARIDALQEEVEDLQVVCDEIDPAVGWLTCCVSYCEQR